MATPKLIHSLLIDAGPIIKNEPPVSTLLSKCEELYTIPAVVDEIRDATTRARIETTLLPFLKLRSPSPASIKVITDFARRTGDLEVLSRPDIHLMALAYELECERNHGDWRLRSVPGQKRLNGAPPENKSEEVVENEKMGEGESQPSPASEPAKTSVEEKAPLDLTEASLVDSMKNAGISVQDTEDITDGTEPISSTEGGNTIELQTPTTIASAENQQAQDDQDEESDDGGWITPSNLKKHQDKDANTASSPTSEPTSMQVALITSDFAMQNVLLRMNLNLMSPSLHRIRQLKTWVLRCHACFYISKDMTKQFCYRCGKPTLLRTACSTDEHGNFKVHLKKNMQWSSRGNVFSIPKPVAGSANGRINAGGGKGGWGHELILAEDQKEYVRAVATEHRRKEKDLMDEDYLPNILSGDRGRAGGRIKVGAGKGVNSRKRR